MPAGDQVASQRLKDETFFLSNMAPQLGPFNRLVWRALETQARDWAEARGEAYIITGPVFYGPAEEDAEIADGFIEYSPIGDGEVAVATRFYKIIVANNGSGEREAIGFILEHRSHSSPYNFSTYIKSIDRIEELTELDFMPGLGDDEAANIEGSESALWELSNYLGNAGNLLAVKDSLNQQKGAKGPGKNQAEVGVVYVGV